MFENKEASGWKVVSKATSAYGEFFKERDREGVRNPSSPSFNLNFPIGLFDGASQEDGGKCGAWAMLKMIDTKVFKLKMDRGKGTNTSGELLALWCLLYFAGKKQVSHLQICGDSKVAIDWMARKCKL